MRLLLLTVAGSLLGPTAGSAKADDKNFVTDTVLNMTPKRGEDGYGAYGYGYYEDDLTRIPGSDKAQPAPSLTAPVLDHQQQYRHHTGDDAADQQGHRDWNRLH